ncbi:MAG: hypothetical protein AB7Q17_13740 [Phycisphaerae bacterium]
MENRGLAVVLEMMERHERSLAELTRRIGAVEREVQRMERVFAELTRQNETRDQSITALGRRVDAQARELSVRLR